MSDIEDDYDYSDEWREREQAELELTHDCA